MRATVLWVKKVVGIFSDHQHSLPAHSRQVHLKVWDILHHPGLTDASSASTGRRKQAVTVESRSVSCCFARHFWAAHGDHLRWTSGYCPGEQSYRGFGCHMAFSSPYFLNHRVMEQLTF